MKSLVKLLAFSVLLGSATNLQCQVDTVRAKVTFKDGKTLDYQVLNQRLNHKKLTTVVGSKRKKLSLRNVKRFSVNDSIYKVSKPTGSTWFSPSLSYRMIDSGAIELLEYRGNYFVRLGGYNYVEFVRKKPSKTLDEYVSDYIELEKGDLSPDSVRVLISEYNSWKPTSGSLSEMEERINDYKLLTIRLAPIILPTISYELGLFEAVTFNNTFGVTAVGIGPNGWYASVGSEAQVRWYFDLKKRQAEGLITKYRSSNFIALGPSYGVDIYGNIYRFVMLDISRQEHIQNTFNSWSYGLGFDPFTQAIGIRYVGLFGIGI